MIDGSEKVTNDSWSIQRQLEVNNGGWRLALF